VPRAADWTMTHNRVCQLTFKSALRVEGSTGKRRAHDRYEVSLAANLCFVETVA
jgi:hypothetical protein